ncbi:PE family protein, partial [Mycobacterium kiyosense]
MSYLSTVPEALTCAVSELAGIGSAIQTANAAAAGPTTRVLTATADEVSEAVAALFGAHAQSYQSLSLQATAFHEQFVRALNAAGNSYAQAEAANAAPLQLALDVINAPTQALLGRPLIGNGAAGTTVNGVGQAGGAGGILWGNGGAGGVSTAAGAAGGSGGSAGLFGNGGVGGQGGRGAAGGS